MPRERLRLTIEQLRAQIASDDTLTARDIRELHEAIEEIEEVVDADDHDETLWDALIDRLREAETNFEESHPNLTLAVGAVANALAKLGI